MFYQLIGRYLIKTVILVYKTVFGEAVVPSMVTAINV